MTTQVKAIEKIRAGYVEKETTKMDELKALDKKVKRPVEMFAYIFGVLSALILGTGMCLAMKVIGASLPFGVALGVVIGVVGIALVSVNYSLYKYLLKNRKSKYASRIIELSDDLLNN